MNSASEKVNAYKANQSGSEDVRDTEARALLSCANRLEAARQPGTTPAEFLAAIKHNQRLWTIFQVCLCDPENQLPRELKVTLLNISRYVDKASLRAIAEKNPNVLASLIDINRNIAAGLSVRQQQTQAPPVPPPESVGPVMTTA